MSIKINLHKTQRQFTDGKETIEVTGDTVGDCIKDLIRMYPRLESELLDKKGKLQSVYEIYLNGESAYPDEMVKKVQDGDEIHVLAMLAGG